MRKISVVIPVYRDLISLTQLLGSLQKLDIAEVIVVEAEQENARKPQLSSPSNFNIKWLKAPKGRGAQIAGGIAQATHPLVWVLHADSQPLIGSATEIRRLLRDPWTSMACFPVSFRNSSAALKLFSACSRVESPLTTFGDQGYAFRREDYMGLNLDLKSYPLLEDVVLRKSLKRLGRIRKSNIKLSTSGRRFKRVGVWRTQALNMVILAQFWQGKSPAALYKSYYKATPETAQSSRPSLPVRPVSKPLPVQAQRMASDYQAA